MNLCKIDIQGKKLLFTALLSIFTRFCGKTSFSSFSIRAVPVTRRPQAISTVLQIIAKPLARHCKKQIIAKPLARHCDLQFFPFLMFPAKEIKVITHSGTKLHLVSFHFFLHFWVDDRAVGRSSV